MGLGCLLVQDEMEFVRFRDAAEQFGFSKEGSLESFFR